MKESQPIRSKQFFHNPLVHCWNIFFAFHLKGSIRTKSNRAEKCQSTGFEVRPGRQARTEFHPRATAGVAWSYLFLHIFPASWLLIRERQDVLSEGRQRSNFNLLLWTVLAERRRAPRKVLKKHQDSQGRGQKANGVCVFDCLGGEEEEEEKGFVYPD